VCFQKSSLYLHILIHYKILILYSLLPCLLSDFIYLSPRFITSSSKTSGIILYSFPLVYMEEESNMLWASWKYVVWKLVLICDGLISIRNAIYIIPYYMYYIMCVCVCVCVCMCMCVYTKTPTLGLFINPWLVLSSPVILKSMWRPGLNEVTE
jgi:hypothetical protein